MITIDRTTPYRPIRNTNSKPVTRSEAVEDLEVNTTTKIPLYDRRKNPDRRKNNQGNGFLETRSGKDRRKKKVSQRRSIDIEA